MNVENIFAYHEPTEEQLEIIQEIQERCKYLCKTFLELNRAKDSLEEMVRDRLPNNEHKEIGLSILWNLEPGEEQDVIIDAHKLSMMLNASVLLGDD